MLFSLSNITRTCCRAFSLVEVVVALGITVFALVAILGLMPVGLQISNDSEKEARSGTITQQIFTALRSGAPRRAKLSMEPEGPLADHQLDLTAAGSVYAAFDAEGRAVEVLDASTAQSPVSTGRAAYVAEIRVTPSDPVPGVSRVEIFLQSPAAAPLAGRTIHSFASAISTR